PSQEQLDRAVAAIEELSSVRPTLLCCGLGYSRSATAIAAWLFASRRADSVDHAVDLIRSRRRVVLTDAHWTALRTWGDCFAKAPPLRGSVLSRTIAAAPSPPHESSPERTPAGTAARRRILVESTSRTIPATPTVS